MRFFSIMKILLVFTAILLIIVLPIPSQALQLGMEGPQVKNLQENLYFLGYDVSPDGLFGAETKEAVAQFQRDHGLDVDGEVGEVTAYYLYQLPQSLLYVVQDGDNLWDLARDFGSSPLAIKQANQIQRDTLFVGEELVIPNTPKAFSYVVEVGDSLEGLAARFDIPVSTLVQLNQVSSASIQVGEMLLIPCFGSRGDREKERTHIVQTGETLSFIGEKYQVSVAALQGMNQLLDDKILIGEKLAIPSLPSPGQEVKASSFIWPVTGPISSPYGWRIHPISKERQFHGGIDIVVPTGTLVRAAASGKVVESYFAGGFGKTIVLDHGQGLLTRYAHNSRLFVSTGDVVIQGRIIAISGNTGISTGPHLDFRVFVDGETVDPLDWLPENMP